MEESPFLPLPEGMLIEPIQVTETTPQNDKGVIG